MKIRPIMMYIHRNRMLNDVQFKKILLIRRNTNKAVNWVATQVNEGI